MIGEKRVRGGIPLLGRIFACMCSQLLWLRRALCLVMYNPSNA